jgi:hypothetical protein
MEIWVEIAISAAVQVATLVFFLGGMRSDVKNLTGWVLRIDERSQQTALKVAAVEGQLEVSGQRNKA